MATATVPRDTSAPTEAEIREAIAERARYPFSGDPFPRSGEGPLRAALRGIAGDYSDPVGEAGRIIEIGTTEYGEGADTGLWRDLRASEAARLRDLVDAAIERAADAAERVIIDELVAAGVTFAGLYPDAPRAQVSAA